MRRALRLLVLVFAISVGVPPAAMSHPSQTDAVIAVGSLVHHRASNSLFHIDGLWMRAAPGTVFHRWMLTGTGRTAAIAVTLQPDNFADLPNIRIMTGRLIHSIMPNESPFVHVFFLQDLATGLFGTLMFETRERSIMLALDAWSDLEVSIVIEIRPE